jgi:hypothetical protein
VGNDLLWNYKEMITTYSIKAMVCQLPYGIVQYNELKAQLFFNYDQKTNHPPS